MPTLQWHLFFGWIQYRRSPSWEPTPVTTPSWPSLDSTGYVAGVGQMFLFVVSTPCGQLNELTACAGDGGDPPNQHAAVADPRVGRRRRHRLDGQDGETPGRQRVQVQRPRPAGRSAAAHRLPRRRPLRQHPTARRQQPRSGQHSDRSQRVAHGDQGRRLRNGPRRFAGVPRK